MCQQETLLGLTGASARGPAEVLEAAALRMAANTSVVSLGELMPALVACPAWHDQATLRILQPHQADQALIPPEER